jgi:hypothetical protein
VLFPLRQAGGGTSGFAIAPDAVAHAGGAGRALLSTGQGVEGPGGALAPASPADGQAAARAGRPGAVDILLGLIGPSDGAEQVSVASVSAYDQVTSVADPAPGTETGPQVVSAVGRNNGWSAETSPAPVEVQFAGLFPDEQTPALPPAGTAEDAGAEPPPGPDAGEQRRGDRTPGGRVSHPVTALLVLGSVCLTWGICQTARRATREEDLPWRGQPPDDPTP